MKRPRIIAIVGTTASGKSSLAVYLAKKFNGEIISADSRQVYRGLDIGTEKISKKDMRGVRHHLLSVTDPKRIYSAADFKKDAKYALRKSLVRGKAPFVVGGTGLYLDALFSRNIFPDVPPNKVLRKRLAKKTAPELFAILKKLDIRRARTIDRNNPRRLERAIEIATALGTVPPQKPAKSPYDVLWIGLSLDDLTLQKRLKARLKNALSRGLVRETKKLQKTLSRKRVDELGLEYRMVAAHLRGELTKEELRRKLETELWHYAKRQKTWFKRNKNIVWFKPEETKKAEKEVQKFLR